METPRSTERRRHPRFNLAPMYSGVQAHRASGDGHDSADGHAYNISEGGIRIELDHRFEIGERVKLDIALPGAFEEVHVSGKVVWILRSDDDPAARRMAVQFDGFET